MYSKTEISNLEDFDSFIRCYNYWGMEGIPLILFAYLMNSVRLEEVKINIRTHWNYELEIEQWTILIILHEIKDIGTICVWAASNGHLECLKYAHENGCCWDEDTCYKAAYNGHLECLKYAHENGCPWNEDTCSNAAYNGHLE